MKAVPQCDCPCHRTGSPITPAATGTSAPPPYATPGAGGDPWNPCADRCHRCGGTPAVPHCPPPPYPCHEGTANLPPHDAPPTVTTEPPDDGTHPGAGDPGELGWFASRVRGVARGGPSFGSRKNEYLPLLLVRANPGDRGARSLPGVFWESARHLHRARDAAGDRAAATRDDGRSCEGRSADDVVRARLESRPRARVGCVRRVLVVQPEPRLQLTRTPTASAPRWSISATGSRVSRPGARSRVPPVTGT